jgi:hypothetical protein
MAVLTPERHADLQTSTLAKIERQRFVEIATDLREYHVFPNLVLFGAESGNASRFKTIDGGTKIDFEVMLNHNGASSHVGIGGEDNPVTMDVLDRASVPWRHTTTQWGMFQQILAMNRGNLEKIVDMEMAHDIAARISLAVLMENTYWGAPVSSSDEVTPYGFFTWFPKSASTGFLGAFPSGFTTLGLDNEHTRWKHYVDAYTNVTADDLVLKIWTALEKTKWKNPVAGIPNLDAGLDRAIYTNLSTKIALSRIAMSQNDNVGYDLAHGHGMTTIRNIPILDVAKLDADTTDPVCLQDWATMKCVALAGEWLKRLTINNWPGQHRVDAKFIDSTYNFVCYNRRKNGVISKGTTYPS